MYDHFYVFICLFIYFYSFIYFLKMLLLEPPFKSVKSNLTHFQRWPDTDLHTSKLAQAFPRQIALWYRQFVQQEWKDVSPVLAHPENTSAQDLRGQTREPPQHRQRRWAMTIHNHQRHYSTLFTSFISPLSIRQIVEGWILLLVSLSTSTERNKEMINDSRQREVLDVSLRWLTVTEWF